jgi:hypothetical protein
MPWRLMWWSEMHSFMAHIKEKIVSRAAAGLMLMQSFIAPPNHKSHNHGDKSSPKNTKHDLG